MKPQTKNKSTREGPACGESLGALESQRIGPIVYGGANVCLMGGSGDRSMEGGESESESGGKRGSLAPATRALQPRVMVERVPMVVDVESGATSDCSFATVESDASGRFWQGRKRLHQDGGLSESSGGETTPKLRVRGRGRPPTTGEYVGLAQAKEHLNAQKREEMRLQAEMERAVTVEAFRKKRTVQPSGPVEEFSSRTAEELQKRVEDEVALIGVIAAKSSNLKSQYVRDLRTAAATIAGATAEITSRTVNDETRRLRLQKASVEGELSGIRKELESLKVDMERLRARHAMPSPSDEAEGCPAPKTSASKRRRTEPETAQSLEEVCKTVLVTVGNMMDARLAALEDRLLPEKTLRPPLAGDQPARAAPEAATSAPKVPGGKKKAKKAKGKEEETETFVPAPPPAPLHEAWNRVAGRGKKKTQPQPQTTPRPQTRQQPPTQPQPQKKTQPQTQPQPPTQPQPQWQQQGRKKKGKKKRERKLRTPRSAAVVVTLKPEAEAKGVTYAQVLAEAKRHINLAEIGIPGLRIKKTATGARLMEVAGANNAERADALAAKLRSCLGDEVVRVHRPVRTAEMRVSGLDDSTTVEEVSAAIAGVGGCPVDQVQTGLITVGADGLGSAWLRCPVAAARKVVDGGRLLVGWVSAQVKLLEARTQRCFRCLEGGHVKATCKSEVDRSDECYRCGEAGHKARGCNASPHCKTCSAAGKPADHRAGGKACTPPPKRNKRSSGVGPRADTQGPHPSTSRAEMDEEMAAT